MTILHAHGLPILEALGIVLQLSQIHLPLLLIVRVHHALSALQYIIRLLLAAIDFLRRVAKVAEHLTVPR